MFDMRRREFVTLLGGARRRGRSRRARSRRRKLPTDRDSRRHCPPRRELPDCRLCAATSRTRLDRWANVAIEYRWAEGRNERLPEIAAEFVRLKVDVIVTVGNPGNPRGQARDNGIPIVFLTAVDPVGTGLVASLARPGGNITGLAAKYPILLARDLKSCAR